MMKTNLLHMQISRLLAVLILALCLLHKAQAQSNVQAIYGTVMSQDSMYLLPNTHVINKRTYQGTITNQNGEFAIEGEIDDTIVFSNVSFKFYYYKITGSEPDNLIIKLETRNYLLDEVSVSAYRLTSNNPKPMAVGKPMIPKTSDIKTPQAVAPTLANPVDFLYYLFARHPKQLEKLRQLYAQDYYKQKLQEGNNREILVRLTGMPKQELEEFMFYCKYADTHIRTINDYEFLRSLLACYDEYEKDKSLNQLLDEQEVQEKTQGERFKD